MSLPVDAVRRFAVSTEPRKPGTPTVTIEYRMDKHHDGWKVCISLVTVYRNTFKSGSHGIDGNITALARRNESKAAGESEAQDQKVAHAQLPVTPCRLAGRAVVADVR